MGQSVRNHDAHVFQASNLYKVMDGGVFVPGNPVITIEGVAVPPLILGDAEYSMRKWLVIPFTGNLTRDQAAFNRAHSWDEIWLREPLANSGLNGDASLSE